MSVPTTPQALTPSPGTAPTPGEDTANKGPQPAKPNAYAWLLAWGVLLASLALINRTRIGHAAIYYGLLLLLAFVLLSNYRFITTALAPFNTLPAN